MLTDDYRANGRRSLKRAELSLAHLRDFFGAAKAVRITTDRINAYVRHRLEQEAAPASIQKELAALRRAFVLAHRAGKVAGVPHVPRLELDNVREGFFEEADFRAVIAELPADVRPLVEFLYLTGWRKSEAQGLQWRQVDFKAGVVRLEPGTTKHREGRTFPFSALPRLKELLREQRAHTEALEKDTGSIVPHVFHRRGKPIRDFRGAWEGACVRAGLGQWKDPKTRSHYVGAIVHDLRRTAVRNLERAGVPRSVAMKLTGHKTEAVYRRYAIVAEADLREGLEKLARLHASADRTERTTVPFPKDGGAAKGTTGGQSPEDSHQAAGQPTR